MAKQKPRGWKTQKVRAYLKKHPNAGHREFVEKTGVDVTDAVFYTQRKKMNGGVSPKTVPANGNGLIPPDFIVHEKMRETYDALSEYLKENPDSTFGTMEKDLGIGIASSTFCRFKKRCLAYWKKGGGKSSTPSRSTTSSRTARKKMYQPIFTVDSGNVSDGAKSLLKQFVEALNETKVGRYEVREYRDPREIEVREVQ